MTSTMVFDEAMADRERSRPAGEVWTQLLRGLRSLLRSAGGGGGSGPPTDEPPSIRATVQEARALRTLDSAYLDVDYSPTYLTQPEPEPNRPPDQPDPPPSGYTHVEPAEKGGRTWSTILSHTLLAVFSREPSSARRRSN